MANKKSAQKRARSNEKKRDVNRSIKSQVATAIKKFRDAIEKNDPATAEVLLAEAFSVIDSAASKGVIHKNNAANKKASMSKTLSDLKSGKLVIAEKIDNKARMAKKREEEAAAKAARKKEAEERAKAKEAAKADKAKKAKKDEKAAPAKKAKKTEEEVEAPEAVAPKKRTKKAEKPE